MNLLCDDHIISILLFLSSNDYIKFKLINNKFYHLINKLIPFLLYDISHRFFPLTVSSLQNQEFIRKDMSSLELLFLYTSSRILLLSKELQDDLYYLEICNNYKSNWKRIVSNNESGQSQKNYFVWKGYVIRTNQSGLSLYNHLANEWLHFNNPDIILDFDCTCVSINDCIVLINKEYMFVVCLPNMTWKKYTCNWNGYNISSVVIDNKIIICGVNNGISKMLMYNLRDSVLSTELDLTFPLSSSVKFNLLAIHRNLYNISETSIERFDYEENKWDLITSLPIHRKRFTTGVIDCRIYLFHGQSKRKEMLCTFDCFDTLTNEWCAAAEPMCCDDIMYSSFLSAVNWTN